MQIPLVDTRSNGTLSNIARPRRRAGRKLRCGTAVRKRSQRVRGEEARIGLLELLDEIQIQRRRRACALSVLDDRVECLPLQIGLACVIHQHRIQRRRVHRGRRSSVEDDAPAAGIVQQDHARRQRDLDPYRRVLGDPARSRQAIVETIVEEERVVRVFGQARHGFLGRERASPLAMARAAGAAIAAKRLHIEESSTLLKPPFRALF